MDELENNLDGKISFEEFIKCMGAIIFVYALVNEGQADSTDKFLISAPDEVKKWLARFIGQ